MWDRFDDAMDDLEERIDNWKRLNQALEQELQARGINVQPECLPPELPAEEGDYRDSAIRNRGRECDYHEQRNAYLNAELLKSQPS